MTATLQDYAMRLQNDISQRRLVPGSRYLTAEETARLLGTSVATANRALRVLADQEIVVRRKNSGTFVGPAVASFQTDDVQTVSILAPAFARSGAVRFDLLIQSVVARLPDVADIRVSYIPAERSVDFVRGLLEPLRDSGKLAGVVAVSCPREVYRYLGENNYPMVVLGSLYADQPYPSVDTDEHQAGRMLTEYLIERGHKRIALFSDSEGCPGDSKFHDGVSEALTAASFPHNALIWRAPGLDPGVLKAQVDELLAAKERPTSILVRLTRWADEIAELVRARGLRVPEDIEIVFKGFALGEPGRSAFPHVRPCIPYREMADLVGQLLAQVRERRPIENPTIVIPYELRRSSNSGIID